VTGWLIFGLCLALLAVGEYLFVVIGIATVLCVAFVQTGGVQTGIASDLFSAVDKEVLLAIPFFIVAGGLITRGQIAARLVELAKALLGWIPGGLALTAVLACMFFAAISGSSPVTLIAIGSMLYPSMIKEGYPERFNIGLLSTGGTLGIIIPPSIPMIVYAIMVGESLKGIDSEVEMTKLSVTNLFIAGVGPGLLLGGLLMVYAFLTCFRMNLPRMPFSLRSVGVALYRGIWALLLPVVILGGIYLGYFTATESAAAAVVYALFVELVFHRELKLRQVPDVLLEAAELMGQLFPILVLAYSFNLFLTFESVPEAAAEWLQGVVSSKVSFLILANLFLLVVGCLMDIMSAILIFAPLLAPMVAQYGIDPVHFGIIFIVNLEIGYLTPPMGINLFVASGLFKKPLIEVVKAVFPFIMLYLLGLALVTYFPWISLALVHAMGK